MVKKLLLFLSLFIFSATPAFTANHYIRDGGTGDGSAWNNALDDIPSPLTRGDTYYIADGTYTPYLFDDDVDGEIYIYIKKAIESDHGTDTGWDSEYGNGQAIFSNSAANYIWNFSTSYYDINGQVGTSNNETSYGFRLYNTSTSTSFNLIDFDNDGTSYINVSYTDMEHAGATSGSVDAHAVIYLNEGPGVYFDHITISHCYLHDCAWCPFIVRRTTYLTVEYCYIARNQSWSGQHAQGMSASFESDNNTLANNIWEDIEGTGCINFVGNGWKIYGNLLFRSPGYPVYDTSTDNPNTRGENGGDGAIGTWGEIVANAEIHNNTIVDYDSWWILDAGIDLGPSSTGCSAFNNAWYNTGAKQLRVNTHDYNMSDDTFVTAGDYNETNGVQWTGGSGLFADYESQDYRLAQATVTGSDLGSPYNEDMLGSIRGDDSVWDRGAYEHESGNGGNGGTVNVTLDDGSTSMTITGGSPNIAW